MNFLPLELENLILDYKYQLEHVDKMKKVFDEMKVKKLYKQYLDMKSIHDDIIEYDMLDFSVPHELDNFNYIFRDMNYRKSIYLEEKDKFDKKYN